MDSSAVSVAERQSATQGNGGNSPRKASAPPNKSKRLRERVRLMIPVRVMARTNAGQGWNEMTRLIDVTPFGARFTLTHMVERGRFCLVTDIRSGLKVLAVVRACRTGTDNIPRLHLEFLDHQWPLDGVS